MYDDPQKRIEIFSIKVIFFASFYFLIETLAEDIS